MRENKNNYISITSAGDKLDAAPENTDTYRFAENNGGIIQFLTGDQPFQISLVTESGKVLASFFIDKE